MWPSIHTRNLCSAFKLSKCTHTQTQLWTHTSWTHTQSSGQLMLQHPGSSWGFGALLKGLTSVVVLKVERKHWLFTPPPPPTITARPETRTCNLRVTSPTLYPLGHDCLEELLSHYSPSCALRSGHLVVPRISKSTVGGRSFSYFAPKLWNNLPNTAREADTLCQFKSRLKTCDSNLAYT